MMDTVSADWLVGLIGQLKDLNQQYVAKGNAGDLAIEFSRGQIAAYESALNLITIARETSEPMIGGDNG